MRRAWRAIWRRIDERIGLVRFGAIMVIAALAMGSCDLHAARLRGDTLDARQWGVITGHVIAVVVGVAVIAIGIRRKSKRNPDAFRDDWGDWG